MKRFIFFIIAIILDAFSQGITNFHDDNIICYNANPAGFISINEQQFNETLLCLKNTGNNCAKSAINVTGTIASISENLADMNDVLGESIPIHVMSYLNGSHTATRLIALKSTHITLSTITDSSMLKNFNDNHIYIPATIEASIGDSIFIENYTAVFNDTCYFGKNTQQKSLIFGNFIIIPQNSASIKKRPQITIDGSTPRNRNACGQFIKNKTSKIIQY